MALEKENYQKNLNDDISEKEKIKKNYLVKEENEKKLNEKLNQMENVKNELNQEIMNLKEDKSLLTVAINKDIGTLKQFHDLGLLTNIKIDNSCMLFKLIQKQINLSLIIVKMK